MKTVYSLLLILICSAICIAQANPNLEQGMKPFGSYVGGDIDSVSLSNGNLRIEIPVWSAPQRGALPLKFVLLYNSKGFFVKQHCNLQTGENCTSQPVASAHFKGIIDHPGYPTGSLFQTDRKYSLLHGNRL